MPEDAAQPTNPLNQDPLSEVLHCLYFDHTPKLFAVCKSWNRATSQHLKRLLQQHFPLQFAAQGQSHDDIRLQFQLAVQSQYAKLKPNEKKIFTAVKSQNLPRLRELVAKEPTKNESGKPYYTPWLLITQQDGTSILDWLAHITDPNLLNYIYHEVVTACTENMLPAASIQTRDRKLSYSFHWHTWASICRQDNKQICDDIRNFTSLAANALPSYMNDFDLKQCMVMANRYHCSKDVRAAIQTAIRVLTKLEDDTLPPLTKLITDEALAKETTTAFRAGVLCDDKQLVAQELKTNPDACLCEFFVKVLKNDDLLCTVASQMIKNLMYEISIARLTGGVLVLSASAPNVTLAKDQLSLVTHQPGCTPVDDPALSQLHQLGYTDRDLPVVHIAHENPLSQTPK